MRLAVEPRALAATSAGPAQIAQTCAALDLSPVSHGVGAAMADSTSAALVTRVADALADSLRLLVREVEEHARLLELSARGYASAEDDVTEAVGVLKESMPVAPTPKSVVPPPSLALGPGAPIRRVGGGS